MSFKCNGKTQELYKSYEDGTRFCLKCKQFFCFCKDSITKHNFHDKLYFSISNNNLKCDEKMPKSSELK